MTARNVINRIWISFLMIAIIVLANLSILLTSFTPDPITYPILPFALDKTEYWSGDSLTLSVYRCNQEGRPMLVTAVRYFNNVGNGQRVPLPPGTGVAQVGCMWDKAEIIGIFPDEMPPGIYTMMGTTTVRGRFKTVDIPWQTVPFHYNGER